MKLRHHLTALLLLASAAHAIAAETAKPVPVPVTAAPSIAASAPGALPRGPTAPPKVAACPAACTVEKENCVAKLGQLAEGNCQDGMHICIERCNPRGQNNAAFEAAEERQLNRRIHGIESVQQQQRLQCMQHCETSSTLCPRQGHASEECTAGRTACIDRCGP